MGNKVLKICNVYAGIGGNRKNWNKENLGFDVDITAVELNPKIATIYQDFFPKDKMVIGDAHQYLLEHFSEYDFIWSSPPCPTHSNVNNFLMAQGTKRYPDMALWQEVILLRNFFKGKWCVENVITYYKPLYSCVERDRHYFWSNFFIGDWESGRKKDMKITITNSRESTRRKSKDVVEQLQNYIGFDVGKYDIGDKRKLLANCVNPYLGLHILKESQRDIQGDLFK